MHFEKLINSILSATDPFESIVGYFRDNDKLVTLVGNSFTKKKQELFHAG